MTTITLTVPISKLISANGADGLLPMLGLDQEEGQ